MDVNIYNEIQSITSYLKLSITSQEVAQFCSDEAFTDEQIQAIADFLNYMKDLRHTHLVEMLKTMSRIPSREPKTFENFDFTRIHGKNVDALKNLSSPSTLYDHKNLAYLIYCGVARMHLRRFNLHKTNAANEELVISLIYVREVQERSRYPIATYILTA